MSIPSSPTFSCDVSIPSQSNIQVDPDDIILACIDNNNPLDVLAESASGYKVYQGSSDSCGNSDIPASVSLSNGDRLSNFAVHVYAGEYGLP